MARSLQRVCLLLLEDSGVMDPNYELDLYSLHYVFLPLIQKQLDCFRAHHPLRTERNRTPQQLWILGLQAMNMEDETHPAVTGTSVVSIVFVSVLQMSR